MLTINDILYIGSLQIIGAVIIMGGLIYIFSRPKKKKSEK